MTTIATDWTRTIIVADISRRIVRIEIWRGDTPSTITSVSPELALKLGRQMMHAAFTLGAETEPTEEPPPSDSPKEPPK